jgi:predicted nucleotidyltransferase
MLTSQLIREKRQAILDLARHYGATNVRIFGSMARGDFTDASDLDLVVRFEPGRSLLDHGGLVTDLGELLGTRVDVIDEDGMRLEFRRQVLKEAMPL